MKMTMRTAAALCVVFALQGGVNAAEYFVNKRGSDANNGSTRAQVFLTIQKGVNALQPGDTLTVAPGEYFESVRCDKLGGAEKDTLIRAEIPGTVVLRGDVPVPEFRKLDGSRFCYVADFSSAGDVQAVNELDTLKIFERMPNAAELEFMPAVFYHDAAAKKLYISTSDMAPPSTHRYSASVTPAHGLYLSNPRRVTIEGIAATGFNAAAEMPGKDLAYGAIWGIFVANGKQCVIRDCSAYLNGQGIGLNSGGPASGDNVIERCAAWRNITQYGSGERAALAIFSGRRDVIRDSKAYLNGTFGIHIYGTGTDGGTYGDPNVPSNDEANKSRLSNNLSWGHVTDFKIKTGVDYFHVAERCVGLGLWEVREKNAIHCLIGREERTHSRDNIVLNGGEKFDPQRELADPDNYDYRLQATSRFRGAAPDGSDRGPFPYKDNIFYVKPDGDDAADGLSVEKAWKSLASAAKNLRPGDTLYLEPGVYPGTLALAAQGKPGEPVAIRGRGRQEATITGAIRLEGGRYVTFERIHFAGEVVVANGSEISFRNCRFTAGNTGLLTQKTTGLALSHCAFSGFRRAALELRECTKVDLRGNMYENQDGAAVQLDRKDAVQYSDYNGYRSAAAAWEVGGQNLPLAALPNDHDAHSREAPDALPADGPMGKAVGPCRDEPLTVPLRLIEKPQVHSVSATTANVEWLTSLPATCEVAWGETPACANTALFEVTQFGTYSLTGLKPGATYYFRINSLKTPSDLLELTEPQSVKLTEEPVSFTTLKADAAPATYYVAADGDDRNSGTDRQHAWKTIGHAASKVNAGDTILIAKGTYPERVRIRATGSAAAPITFKCIPGEKVFLSGAGKALNAAFVVAGKSHLRFDGLYLADSNREHTQDWHIIRQGGEFNLYHSKDIQVTRCFSHTQSGYTARFISAREVQDLLVKNCVTMNKMTGAFMLERCPNLRVENSVIARPMICSFVLRNDVDDKATMDNCIFTDMLKKKADQNIMLFAVDYRLEGFRQNNCDYFLRSFPPETRILLGKSTARQLEKHITAPLFADPAFAGAVALTKAGEKLPEFSVELLMNPAVPIDFNSFFATNPEVVKRGIGLQPEAFADFRFDPLPTAKK